MTPEFPDWLVGRMLVLFIQTGIRKEGTGLERRMSLDFWLCEFWDVGTPTSPPKKGTWGWNWDRFIIYMKSSDPSPKGQRHLWDTALKRNSMHVILALFKKYKERRSHVKWLGICCFMTVQFRYQNTCSWIFEIMLSKISAQGTYPVSKICWPASCLAMCWNKISLSQIIMLRKYHLANI